MKNDEILTLLDGALRVRGDFLDVDHTSTVRLFNGFLEGCPALTADVFSRTLLLTGRGDTAEVQALFDTALEFYRQRLPWIKTGVLKMRDTANAEARRGVLAFGEQPDAQINENSVKYAVNLLLNQDAGFYLDTRGLRVWLKSQSKGKSVLNLFAYTGSLGVAALAGGARRVVQVDKNRKFLELAQKSGALNRLDNSRMALVGLDFFSAVSRFKSSRELFDIVILDPPFFSTTTKGRVDLVGESVRMINKVRPLVQDGGFLVTVNNALFLSGADYHASLEGLCKDGYLAIDRLIPVGEDFTGTLETRRGAPPVDPAPFNHSTKIAVLRVRRKDAPLIHPTG